MKKDEKRGNVVENGEWRIENSKKKKIAMQFLGKVLISML